MTKQEIKDLHETVERDGAEIKRIRRKIAALRVKLDETSRRRNNNAFRLLAAQRELH